jgi:hypothetical protein
MAKQTAPQQAPAPVNSESKKWRITQKYWDGARIHPAGEIVTAVKQPPLSEQIK